MSVAKQTTKKKHENKHKSPLINEIIGLRENNRDLAKSLAEKRREVLALRDIVNKYDILENKYKINKDHHYTSISNMEEYLKETCSHLLNVVERISDLYSSLEREKNRYSFSFSPKINKDNGIVSDKQNNKSPASSQLSELKHILNQISSSKSPKIDNANNTQSEIFNISHSEDDISEHRYDGNTPRVLFAVIENDGETSLNLDESSTEKRRTLDSSQIDVKEKEDASKYMLTENECSVDNTLVCEERNDHLLEIIMHENSQIDKVDKNVMFVNERYILSEGPSLRKSIGADTYDFSQDEAFQNFLADEETIIRRGVDDTLLLPKECTIPSNGSPNLFFEENSGIRENESNNEKRYPQNEENSTLPSYCNTHPIENINLALYTDPFQENIFNYSSTDHSNKTTEELGVIQITGSPIHNVMDLIIAKDKEPQKTSVGLNQTLEKSRIFRNSNICKSEQNQANISRELRRKSQGCNFQIFYSESDSPNACTEMYLRRYNCLPSINANNVSSKNGRCTGKENIHSTAHKSKCKSSVSQKSRKPLQDRQNEKVASEKNKTIKSLQNENEYSLQEKTNLNVTSTSKIISKNSDSQDAGDVVKEGIAKPRPRRKCRRKIRKKENLRLL